MLQSQEIAEKEQISKPFLDQIFVILRSAGLVGTRRGKHGGYYLRRPLEQIVIGEVVRTIDGPLAPIRCVSQTAYERCTCPDEEHCGLRMLMLDVRNAIANILDRYTLADVVAVTTRRLKRDGLPVPFEILDAIGCGVAKVPAQPLRKRPARAGSKKPLRRPQRR